MEPGAAGWEARVLSIVLGNPLSPPPCKKKLCFAFWLHWLSGCYGDFLLFRALESERNMSYFWFFFTNPRIYTDQWRAWLTLIFLPFLSCLVPFHPYHLLPERLRKNNMDNPGIEPGSLAQNASRPTIPTCLLGVYTESALALQTAWEKL